MKSQQEQNPSGNTVAANVKKSEKPCQPACPVWGVCLVAFFAYAGFAAYDPSEIGGTVFYGLVLLVVTPIPILAFLQKAGPVSDPDC